MVDGEVLKQFINPRVFSKIMAKRRAPGIYKQVKTGTVDLGNEGLQFHIAEIKMIDEALRGSFLNNVQYSVMDNGGRTLAASGGSVPAFTLYLSYRATTWDDDSVIAVSSTAAGGGNGNLSCKRVIKTNETGSTVAEQIGPVHVWIECTDLPVTGESDMSARVTLTAWGRMILLVSDF